MATNTEMIESLGKTVATLSERVALLEYQSRSFGEDLQRIQQFVPESDKRVALLEHKYERLEKRLDEFMSRRWEVVRMVVTAILGLIVGYLLKRP